MLEIARRLNVNQSSVSRALRGDPRIGEELRGRVREMAAKLGYAPNPLVSALMATRRGRGGASSAEVIALVTNYGGREDWRSKDVCRWEYQGIQQRARELGFRIEVFALGAFRNDVARLQATLRARGIRGVLLGFSREERECVSFDCNGFCVAGLSAYFPCVTTDRANFHGFFNVQLALDQYQRLGYRRPALIVPELNNRVSNNLWSGAFLDWQRRLPKKDRLEPFIPREDASAAEFSDWLYRNAPDSLLVYKYPVRAMLAARGLSAPDDIGLAWLYRTSDEMGATAGIDGNLGLVGAAALDLVVERLYANDTGVRDYPKEVLIKGTWRDGGTLRPRESLTTPGMESAPRRNRASARARR